MEKLLVFIILLELIPLTCFCFRDADIMKILTLAVSAFLTIYAVVSGLFFTLDQFSFFHVLGAMALFLAPFALYCAVRLGKVSGWAAPCPYGQFLVLGALILASVFLSHSKFELFSAGQDQGLYQAEAIELYMGNFEVEHDFEEYQILENEEDKEAYRDMLGKRIVGYYPLANGGNYMEPFSEDERKSDVSGMYHGVQTFPALLALGGKLFGLENMTQMQTVFLVCSVLLLYFALCGLGIPLWVRLPAALLFLLSPLTLWVSKSSLTEMLLTMFMASYLFLLTEGSTGIKRLLTAVPLVGFAFVHVSFLLLYPAFAGIHLLLYVKRHAREYLSVNVLMSAGLCLGYFMMSRIAPQYFYDNCGRLYVGSLITADNFLIWVCSGSLFACAVSMALSAVKKTEKIERGIEAVLRFLPALILLLLGVSLCYSVIAGYFMEPNEQWFSAYYGQGFWGAFSHSALYAFAMAEGFAVFAALVAVMVVRHRVFLEDTAKLSVFLLLVYCVLFQSAFIRREVFYYYYYSRYLVFYLPLVSAAAAVALKRLANSKKKTAGMIVLVSFGYMLAFDAPLLAGKDETYLEWENLLDLKEAVREDSAVILGDGAANLLGAPLRALTGAAIFPVFEDPAGEISLLQDHYSGVYYIPDEPGQFPDGLSAAQFEVRYRDRYLRWDGSTPDGLFPLRFPSVERQVALYQLKFISRLDPAHMTEIPEGVLEGYYGLEEKLIWTAKDSSALICDARIRTEGLELELVLPDENAGRGQGKFIEVLVSGEKAAEISAASAGRKRVFLKPEELPEPDENGAYRVELHCPDSFVPARIGMNADERELAVQVRYIGRIR